MNTQITNLINDFAKNNRIGKARVEALVSKVMENCSNKTREKKPSKRESQFSFIKNEVITRAKNFEVFSILQLARKLEVSPYLVHKAVMECQRENLIKSVQPEKIPGTRGRQATLWMIS
jgi:hypothetical protein